MSLLQPALQKLAIKDSEELLVSFLNAKLPTLLLVTRRFAWGCAGGT